MNCRLAFYSPEWDSKIRNFTLDEPQKSFVFLPSAAIDWSIQDINCFPVVVLIDDEPVGFFVLHHSEEIINFTDNVNAIFLRAFSIDWKHQGIGYAGLAMNILPKFVLNHFPQVDEIVLTVNENNLPAKRLYEKSGFLYKGKNKNGRSGIELGMHFHLMLKNNTLMGYDDRGACQVK
jgi:RimJ/RimL family protein N-acetyltransferase